MITAVVLTKNEEKNIGECLSHLSFCDSILVIDDHSEDATRTIARKKKAHVYTRSLANNFAEQRNFALEKIDSGWVFFVDADEVVSKELANEIVQITSNIIHTFDGIWMKRTDEMWDKKIRHGECGTIKLLRLAKKDAGTWKREVHETWDVKGETYTVKNPLMHYPHKTLAEFIQDTDHMSSLHALANQKEGKRSNLIKIIFWPPFKFISNYIFRLGFLDGTRGFVIALVMSFHSYLAWSKLWLLQKNNTSSSFRT